MVLKTGTRSNIFFILLLSLCCNQGCNSDSATYVKAYYENGILKEEGLTVKNEKDGLWKTYTDEGQLASITTYKNGKRNGSSISYHKNGKEYVSCFYKDDQLIGQYILYYENGQKNFEETFNNNGRREGLFQLWYKDGRISQKGMQKGGKMIGTWVQYYESGKIQIVQNYSEKGLKDGKSIYLNELGDTLKIEYYKNDSLTKTVNRLY